MACDLPETDRGTAADNDTPSNAVEVSRPPRRLLRLTTVLAVVACLVIVHPWLLQGVGSILVVDEFASLGESDAPPNCVLVVEGIADADGRYDETARLCREMDVRHVVLMQVNPEPAVRCGAVLPSHISSRCAMVSAGVPDEIITVIPGDARNAWQEARQLQPWLKEHPEARLLVLVHPLYSRQQRYVYDSILDSDIAARIFVCGLKKGDSNESNWWKSRHGVKCFMFAGLELLYAWCVGETPPNEDWDPDDYERSLRESLGQRVTHGAAS